MIPSTSPPFRAEHIGSLLRPAALLAPQYERGEIDRAALARPGRSRKLPKRSLCRRAWDEAERNPITVEAQATKLRLIVDRAHQVWGSN